MNKVMCYVIVAFTVVEAGKNVDKLPQELQDILVPFRNECLRKVGATKDEIDNFEFDTIPIKVKCYMHCLLEEGLWLKPNGDINFDFLAENMPQNFMKYLGKALRECKHVKATSEPCSLGYNFHKCFYDIDPNNYYLA